MDIVDRTRVEIRMLQRGLDSQRELTKRLGAKNWTLSKTIRAYTKKPGRAINLVRLF